MTGTVFDIGYQHYAGVREGRARALGALVADGVRTALGLGRGARAKLLPWAFVALLSGIALVMALVAGAANRLGGPGTAERTNLPSHGDYYGIAAVILFVFGALVAPELLCRDRREGVLQLYLVRPITGSDYVVARYVACLAVLTGAAWLPQLILFVGLSMGDPTPGAYLRDHWLDVPRLLLAGVTMAAYVTSLALLVASFPTRRAYAAVFLVGHFVITTPLTVGIAEELPGALGQWVSMGNLAAIPVHVNDVIFGEVSELTEDAPARTLPGAVRVGWYLAWTVGAAAILWARHRRVRP